LCSQRDRFVSTAKGINEFLGPQADAITRETVREVLVVDDDPAILRLMVVILGKAGYEVAVANDGQQAIDCILASPPDFLITDWKMPGVDGIELCRWVRQIDSAKYTYIILFTGRTETRHMVEAISAGADDFFSKPICPGELLSRMQAGLRILERERRLTWLTRYDQLTELLARRSFFVEYDKEWSRSVSEDRPLACVMVDVDCFKRINDEHGHVIGDATLKAIARVLAECSGNRGYACRYGGEEFCVLLPDATEHDAYAWAEDCRSKIASSPVVTSGPILQVTASFGVAERTIATKAPGEMLDRADQALLVAKRRGKNRVVRSCNLIGINTAGMSEEMQPG
jgi:two-component system, cell cycle response regulator